MIIQYKEYTCRVQFGQYGNGNIAIQLVDEADGQLVSTASVNGTLPINEYVVGIKTWSENTGMVDALVAGGVIEEGMLFSEPTGYTHIEYYALTEASRRAIELLKEESF